MNNQLAIYSTQNPVFHDQTKHIEVNYHIVPDVMMKKLICTPFIPSLDQLADILTKSTSLRVFSNLYNKLYIIDIYFPI